VGLAENAERLVVDEMYPAPDGLWLNTARGGFTGEMRMSVFRTRRQPIRENTSNLENEATKPAMQVELLGACQ